MGRHKRNVEDLIINERRVMVSSLMARGLSQHAIVTALAAQKVVNPETNKPYDLTTIHRDTKAVKAEWHERATQSVQDWKNEQVAQIQELMRQAYAKNKLEVVRGCIDLLVKLTGTAEAEKIDLSVRPTKTYLIVSPEDWPDKE